MSNSIASASCQAFSKRPETAKRQGFDPIDRNFWSDKELSDAEVRLLGELSSYSDSFKPSIETVAKRLGWSLNKARKYYKSLVEKGRIKGALMKLGEKREYTVIKKPHYNEQPKAVEPNSTTLPKAGRVTLPNFGIHRNSTKRKSNIIHDERLGQKAAEAESIIMGSDISFSEADKQPSQAPKKKPRGMRQDKIISLVNAFHGPTGYTFTEANQFYKDITEANGGQKAIDALWKVIKSQGISGTLPFNGKNRKLIRNFFKNET